jgi:hypothetical protein
MSDTPPPLDQAAATPSNKSRDNWILIAIAATTIIVHLLVGNRYGFQRDELQTLDDARHLAWGYVVYPPVTPFFARISLVLFGTSIIGFRVFAFIAEAIAVVIAGLMARELGGRRGAQIITAAAAVPFCLAGGALMQYVSFDYLFWVLTSYFVIRLLRSNDARWWLAIGTSIGFGMMSKYGMAFYVAGIIGGMLLTDGRRFFRSKWLYVGIAVCILICLPNLIWQIRHHYISLDFLRSIHERDVRNGRTTYFLPEQLELTLFALPLALAGLYFFLFAQAGKRFRVVFWMYAIPLVIFVIAKGRAYYLAGAYPMLYAAGAVCGESLVARVRNGWRRTGVRALVWSALGANILIYSLLLLPVAPIGSSWFKVASHIQGDYVEEIGWPELVQTLAGVRDSLPLQEQAGLGIIVGNYGEAGAINLYGPHYGLPKVISGTNSFWYRSYPETQPQTLIAVGLSKRFLDRHFITCSVVAHTWNQYNIENEETKDHPDIYLCRGLRHGWPEIWKDFLFFG